MTMSKFIGTTEAECEAFRKGVEFGDESGEVKFSKPHQRGDGLWETRLTEDDDEQE
jgi:hypothetical protein